MKEKIMIVDDEPDVLESLKLVLEHEKYDVVTATNGIECLSEIEKGFKGIILLDLMMPQMDGWETIKEIIKKGYIKDVAIEIISALGIRENKQMGQLEPYIYDYLVKPVDLKDLIQSVEKCNAYLFARNTESKL
jgi:DNA-binding response OmpR family regulator